MATREAARRPAKRGSSRTTAPREVFRLSRSPSHLLRRAEQFAAELFARAAAADEAEGASQSDLVRTTGVDRSTLAEMMARMEGRGLIARAAAADDGRAKSVRLTAEGRRRLDAVLPAIRQVDRNLLAALPASRRAAFQAILAELAEAADHGATEEADPKPARRPARAPRKPAAAKKRPRASR
jgi:MarR family transcriptional regulator, temperature-dependent positive regulator of motility